MRLYAWGFRCARHHATPSFRLDTALRSQHWALSCELSSHLVNQCFCLGSLLADGSSKLFRLYVCASSSSSCHLWHHKHLVRCRPCAAFPPLLLNVCYPSKRKAGLARLLHFSCLRHPFISCSVNPARTLFTSVTHQLHRHANCVTSLPLHLLQIPCHRPFQAPVPAPLRPFLRSSPFTAPLSLRIHCFYFTTSNSLRPSACYP